MAWEHRPVLVTGGCGFIGSHLVEALVDRGATVSVVDDLRSGSLANLGNVLDRVTFYQWDVRSQAFRDLFDRHPFDTVFHFASNSYVPPSVEEPWADFENSLVNTLALLERMRRRCSQAKLIFPSSAAVYGNPAKLPISEDDPTVPISPYGVSKLAAERYAHVYSRLYGIRSVSLRFFSIYGPRQVKQVVYDFIRRLDDCPTELRILGNGQQVRDFVYVKDAVRAMLLVAEKGALAGEVYNVASSRLCTIEALARMIAELLGAKPVLVFDDKIKAGRSGDSDKWSADIRKLQQLGFNPVYSLEEGLKETIQWFKPAGVGI